MIKKCINTKINFEVPREMRIWLDKQAAKKGFSISLYLRQKIKADMDNDK